MLAVISASFKIKLLLSFLLIATASFLTSNLSTYTYATKYRLTVDALTHNAQNSQQPPIASSENVEQNFALDGVLNTSSDEGTGMDADHSSIELEGEVPMGFPYFAQAGEGDILVHYDLRYYLGSPVSPSDRRSTLHHMIRAYLQTMSKHNLETWIAHGTLLGWWWNGRSLPWDWDLDVQVSEETLWKMGREWNMTSFDYQAVSDKEQGIEVVPGREKHTYLLDVNEHIYERTKGVGDNFIDARWIDTSNGLFIDITGISVTDLTDPRNSDRWQCKNEHWYDGNEIWPLRETIFEGVKASVPGSFEKVLSEEYGEMALGQTVFNGYKWNGKEGEWIEMTEEETRQEEEKQREQDKEGSEAVQQADEGGAISADDEDVLVGTEAARGSWWSILTGAS